MNKNLGQIETVENFRPLPRVPVRPPWLLWALIAGLIIVLASTVVTLFRAPSSFSQIQPSSIGGILGDTDKLWMLFIWVASPIAVLYLAWADRKWNSRSGRWNFFTAAGGIVGFALTLILATWQEPKFYSATDPNWYGFSFTQLAIGLLIAGAIFALVTKLDLNGRLLLAISGTVSFSFALLPLIRTPHSFEDSYNNAYTLEEILAPANGRLPGFDYVSQYENLLGFPLSLISRVFPSQFILAPDVFAIRWIIFLQIATLVMAVVAAIVLAPRPLKWLMPVMILPITYLSGDTGRYYYAVFPIRLIIPILILFILVLSWKNSGWFKRSTIRVLVIGALAAISGLNNFDFGIPAAIAIYVTLLWASPNRREFLLRALMLSVGTIVVAGTYILLGYMSGRSFHPSYLLFFVQGFGVNNYMNVDMPVFGLHSAFIFLGVISVLIGALGSRRNKGRRQALHQAILYMGVWLLLSMVYYSGRSLSPVLWAYTLQIAILFALLFLAGFPIASKYLRTGFVGGKTNGYIVVFLTIFSLAIPMAAWTIFPSLQVQFSRLLESRGKSADVPSYLLPDPTAALAHVPAGTDLVGILTTSGSTWAAKLGVRNAGLIVNPGYLGLDWGGAKLQCDYLADLPGKSLLTTSAILYTLGQSQTCLDLLAFGSSRPVDASTTTQSPEDSWVLVDKKN